MTDTILEKDTLSVIVGDDHSFACSVVTLGRTGENAVSQLEINIPEELSGFWAYLDFKKASGKTIKTPRLDIVNNKIEYDIPGGLLDESGNIEVQLVLESENGEIWKSSTKKFVVLKSIDAGDDIPEAESFISEAQKILDETVETTNAFIAEAKEENEAFKEEIEKTTDDFIAESNKKIKEALIIRDGYASGIIKAVSGKAVSLTDISPFKHTLGVEARSKNLMPYPYVDTPETGNTVENAGITYTDNGDGTITANGIATGGSMFTLSNSVAVKKGMSISGSPNGSYPNTFEIQVYKSGNEMISTNGYESSTATVDFVGGARIRIREGYTANNLVFKPQLEIGSATEYTPYVADVSTVTLQSFEKNLYDNSTITNKRDVTAPVSSYKKYKIILPNGTYTWSLQENTFLGAGYYLLFTDYKEFDGTNIPTDCVSSWIGHSGSESLCQKQGTFKVTRGYIYLTSTAPLEELTEIVDKLSTMQIESGTEATPFEPYKEPTPYHINPNGTVDGVTSVYPTTVLTSNTEGVVLDVEYNADTKKYVDNQIDKKIAEVMALVLEN